MANKKKKIMSSARRRMYEMDAKTIAYFRRNPCIAAEELLGIRLLDSQKYVLQGSWNARRSVWTCSRNWGKSLEISVMAILKAVLYENMNIYIVSSVGSQAKETFQKIEELVTRTGKTAASFRSLKDIIANETLKSPTNKTGFSHPAEGYEVHFYNGSSIYTVNSNVDNIRGKHKLTKETFMRV